MNNAMIKDVDGKLQKNEDGTTTIAYIDVIKAKNTVENLREQISKKQIERIQWLTKSQPS